MKNFRLRTFMAYLLTVCMFLNITPVFAATNTADDGIEFTKTAVANSDGTVDITMEAYTTGTVTTSNIVTPTDIILVLDVSGSMDYDSTVPVKNATFNSVKGSSYSYWVLWTAYGFDDNSEENYFIKDGEDYIYVSYVDLDDNRFEYYKDRNGNYYYPTLSSSASNREHNYPVVDFYQASDYLTHMEILKEGADAFIAETAEMNKSITDDSKKHRISIIKFADDSYYNGSSSTTDYEQAVIGDNKSGNTNYTQVVKDFTVVDNNGKNELISAMNALTAGGATAVDYGLQLAVHQFGKRGNESVGRNEVVVVFTDGDPTHGNSYSSSVAGSAINLTKSLKDSGVTVYSIGGANTANSAIEGDASNQFMHYISNNFPTASYSSGTITPGDGSITKGYYMTPSDDKKLDEIFVGIASEVGSSTIQLGPTASVVDVVSQYFTIPDGVNSIKIETADKTANGWANPEPSTLVPTILGDNIVTVTGFDFDANYVSETPRGENGDFYGRKLIITINVTSNYTEIDADTDIIEANGGEIVTNSGLAEVANSDGDPVVTHDSPTVAPHKVIYKVDNKVTNTFYRFQNADVTVIGNPELEGHNFSGWSTQDVTINNGTFTMPAKDVVIEGTFAKENYKVTYQYSGTQPAGAPTPPASHMAEFESEVSIVTEQEWDSSLAGYTFSGWYPQATDITITNGKFTMPAKEVVLLGYYIPDSNVEYKVHHYLMDENGSYDEDHPDLIENNSGTQGHTVQAEPDANFISQGFTYELEYSLDKNAETDPAVDTVVWGTIDTNNPLTLKLYYSRNKYPVTYQLENLENLPVDIQTLATNQIPVDSESPYYHGKTVRVKDPIAIEGYTFSGWHAHTTDGSLEITSGTFTMPARDVKLYGYFTANTDTEYNIEHYVMKVDETDATDLNNYELRTTRTATGTTGSTVHASPLPEIINAGFEYNDSISTASGTVDREGNLVLKLYYTRKQFTVTYKYEGEVPTGVSVLPTDSQFIGKFPVGATVPVSPSANVTYPADYNFVGWYRGTVDNIITSFEMPNHDVVVMGHFEPKSGVPYIIHHYLMDENGDYIDTPDYVENFNGVAGHNATAEYLTNLLSEGYDEDTDKEDKKTGIIKADDPNTPEDETLVLELYYKRHTYKVTYQLENLENLPADIQTLAKNKVPVDNVPHPHGKSVTVKDAIEIEGYTFSGWHPHTTDGSLTIANGKFEMPMRDVTLYGYFTANTDTKYTIEHYVLKPDKTDATDLNNYELHTTRTATGTTGSTVNASPLPELVNAGFEYNSSISTASGTVDREGNLVLKLYYTRKSYSVSYKFEGDVPGGATLPTDPQFVGSFAMGTTVPVAPGATVSGYKFIGWYSGTETNMLGSSFEMPNRNVEILGKFVAETNIPYSIEHYLQKPGTDGDKADDYVLDTASVVKRFGKTNTEASATFREFPGFSFNHEFSAAQNSNKIRNNAELYGTITGDGKFALRFYYTRESYPVEYVLDGTQPHGVTATVPQSYNTENEFDTTVNVKPALSQEGYTFSGWETTDAVVDNGTFTMPAKKVVFKGKFTANNNVPYKVEYYQQKLNTEKTGVLDEYELVENDTFNGTGTSGHLVNATLHHYDGFALNNSKSTLSGYIQGDGNLVLKLYYDRHLYNVEYRYYGETPACASVLPAKKTNIPFGAVLEVEADATCSDNKHHFSGWTSPQVIPGADGKYAVPNVTNETRTVFFYGMFTDKHTVEYDFNGGTGADGVDYSTVEVPHGTVLTVKAAPSRSGYTFKGWLEDTTTYNPGDDLTVSKDTVLVAQWESNSGGGGGYVPTTKYTLTYETNGGESIPSEKHSSGKTVALTKIPKRDGYVFEGWHLDDALTEDVTHVKMDRNITVYASWVEDNGSAGNGYPTPGGLNNKDHFAYVVGYPDGTVRPGNHISRAEVTTIFFRLLTSELRNENLTSSNPFDDLPATAWYTTAISTMTKLGIVNGRTSATFVPDAYITRAEFAAICARFDDSEFEITDGFTDVAGHWAEAEIHEAAAHGWIRGYNDNTFKPDQLITRAEAMTMINRVLNRVPETGDDLHKDMILWPDNSNPSAWYYLPVQEATNSHDYTMKNHIYEKWTSINVGTDWTQYE